MAKTVRLADIGERLGVSTVTVSKALSGQKGVSEELRVKIIRLADEMGYVKNTAEESKAVKESYTIGAKEGATSKVLPVFPKKTIKNVRLQEYGYD